MALGGPQNVGNKNSKATSDDASEQQGLRGQSGCHWVVAWNSSSEKRSNESRGRVLLPDAVMLCEMSSQVTFRKGKGSALSHTGPDTPRVGLSILCSHQHLYEAHLLKEASFLL